MDLDTAAARAAALGRDGPLALTERFHGQLVRDGAGFALRCDDGRLLRLILPRVPVDAMEKRVTVTGRLAEDDLVDADGVAIF